MARGRPAGDETSHAAAGISAQAIAGTALQLVSEVGVGVDGLTMRPLAGRLGVRAPSLYYYIRNKGDLLHLVARHAFASFGPAIHAYQRVRSLDDWIAVTRAGALKARAFYRSTPGWPQSCWPKRARAATQARAHAQNSCPPSCRR